MGGHTSTTFILLTFCLAYLVSAEITPVYTEKGLTLQYVTAIFRHGERTVDAGTEYPGDPYLHETYYPYGVGQLTAKGKEREFALGTLLRKRYDALLGSVYTPDVLEALSTNMNRTKASLSLVLAGLYPPKGNIMEWSSTLNWQPIPYNYLDYTKDVWFTISLYFCPNYVKEYKAYLSAGEGKALMDKYAALYDYLTKNSGLNITKAIDPFNIYSCLESQVEWGLKLPDWTNSVWPEKLTEASKDGLQSGVATTKLKQLSGGLTVKTMINNMKAVSTNTFLPENRKMALYSGHDISIVYVLGALNLYTPHIVTYGACILVELHKIANVSYVKILYEDYTADQPRTLTVPGCEELCPLDKFETILKVNYPEKNDPCGDDVTVFAEDEHHREHYAGRLHHKHAIERYLQWAHNAHLNVTKAVVDLGSGVIDKAKGTIGSSLGKLKDALHV